MYDEITDDMFSSKTFNNTDKNLLDCEEYQSLSKNI